MPTTEEQLSTKFGSAVKRAGYIGQRLEMKPGHHVGVPDWIVGSQRKGPLFVELKVYTGKGTKLPMLKVDWRPQQQMFLYDWFVYTQRPTATLVHMPNIRLPYKYAVIWHEVWYNNNTVDVTTETVQLTASLDYAVDALLMQKAHS